MLFSDSNNLIISRRVETEANVLNCLLRSVNGKSLIEILRKIDPSMTPYGTS